MTECAQCGDCCTGFPLNTPERADIYGRRRLASVGRIGVSRDYSKGADRKLWTWMSNLVPIAGPFAATRIDKDGNERHELRWRYHCPVFDETTRLCGDHTNRPLLCRRFPWYGREVEVGDYRDLSPRCSFVADDPSVTMLPIVEVKHGRQNTGAEAARHCAA